MTFNEYQSMASQYAVYPKTMGREYLLAGLCEEVGEFAGKVKRVIRGDSAVLDVEVAALELGDVLWYVSQLSSLIGISFDRIAEMNLEKLSRRKQTNTIRGVGDYRGFDRGK